MDTHIGPELQTRLIKSKEIADRMIQVIKEMRESGRLVLLEDEVGPEVTNKIGEGPGIKNVDSIASKEERNKLLVKFNEVVEEVEGKYKK